MNQSKEVRDFTDEFLVEDAAPAGQAEAEARETDPHRIAQRQKQIDLGKNTLGYQRYRQQVPRTKRRKNRDPETPDVHKACSKRSFDGLVKKWRRLLHQWDPQEEEEEEQGQGDVAEPAAAPTHSDRSYEHVTHQDAAEQDVPTSGAAPKNGRARQASSSLPQKIPSALKKRNYTESSMTCQPSRCSPAQQALAPSSKYAKRPEQLSRAAGVTRLPTSASAAAAQPAAAEGEVEVDYGEDEDWAYVSGAEAAEAAVATGTAAPLTGWGPGAGADDGLDDIAI